MAVRLTLAAAAALLAAAAPAPAGEFNKVLSVGDPAPAWDGLAAADGRAHRSADLAGAAAVVVVFTCNTCPVADDYEGRLLAFAARYAGKAAVVAVNPNGGRGDGLADMAARAAAKRYPFPYLSDPAGDLARKFGATYTPEFFVLDKDRKVAYLGAMDDKSPPADPTVRHLERAVDAVLAGKPAPVGETLARGCRIRFARPRPD